MKQLSTANVITFVLAIVMSFCLIFSNAWASNDSCNESNLVGRYAFSQSGQFAAGLGFNTPVAIAGYAKLKKHGRFIGSETVSVGASAMTGMPDVNEILFCDGTWEIMNERRCIVDFEWEAKVAQPGQDCGEAYPIGTRTARAYIAPSLEEGYIITTVNDGTVVVGPVTR